jgi:MFS family permease
MKIDLVGPKQRGLAMGLNEFAGYLAVALGALSTGYIAQGYGLRPEPFYLGIACVAVGLALSLLFVRETRHHVDLEAAAAAGTPSDAPSIADLTRASWRHPVLGSASQAGLVNNLNDGLAWGLFPLYFAAAGLDVAHIGILAFTYPAVWGVLQLWTGALSDRRGRKGLIAGGMILQAGALAGIALARGFWPWVGAAALLGVGTAMVYPTLLAAVADVTPPKHRGSAVGIYRLWRDSGYVAGALIAGTLADHLGMSWSILGIALLTLGSGLLVMAWMPETVHYRQDEEH